MKKPASSSPDPSPGTDRGENAAAPGSADGAGECARAGGPASNFDGADFGNKATRFESPTALPRDEAERRAWQDANRAWWESTPMRYDWRHGVGSEPGSREYFAEVDARFLSSARQYLPWRSIPFDTLIDFPALHDRDVLEIGVGQGTHAQLIAPRCRRFTGIDLTRAACAMAGARFELAGLPGAIVRMDAEAMAFADASFDFIWSWGVIHHSADTSRVLREMHRVLRPGGEATVMVYHRSRWKYYVMDGFFKGVLHGGLARERTLHRVSQAATDGAIARYYRPSEWAALCDGLFRIESTRVLGQKSDLVPLPAGRLKARVLELVPDRLARTATNAWRAGSFLVARMRRL